jgi:hypothetical protein
MDIYIWVMVTQCQSASFNPGIKDSLGNAYCGHLVSIALVCRFKQLQIVLKEKSLKAKL